MPRKKEGRESITVLLTTEQYNTIKRLSAKDNKSMNEICREFITQGLDGNITEGNLEILAPLLRNLIRDVTEPQVNRLASLVAKTCIISGTAAYLAADATYKWVPENQREDVKISFDRAYQQGVAYTRKNIKPGDNIKL